MGLAGLKTISMVLLIVLVALAGGSPVFATDYLVITPVAACPGAKVSVTGYFAASGGALNLYSDPDMMANRDCEDRGSIGGVGDVVACTFDVMDSACAGPYTVTMTLAEVTHHDVIVGSASVQFTVGTNQCPNVPSCSTAAVGGCVQPVNTFALLSPWLAVIGLVGCVGTIVVVAKKRHA